MSQADPHRELQLEINGITAPLAVAAATWVTSMGDVPTMTLEISATVPLDATDLIGKRANFQMRTAKKVHSHFIGEVHNATLRHWDDDHTEGTLAVVGCPTALLLGHNFRAYTELSVIDIIERIIQRHEGLELDKSLVLGSYPSIDYCVQYDESDFAFIQRIAKLFGIGFIIDSETFPSKLKLIDDARGFARLDPIPYRSRPSKRGTRIEEITELTAIAGATCRTYIQDTYLPELPKKILRASAPGARPTHGISESVAVSTPYKEVSHGNLFNEARLRADQSRALKLTAETTSSELATGTQFELRDHPNPAHNRAYYVTQVIQHITGATQLTGSAPSAGVTKQATLHTDPKSAVLAYETVSPMRIDGVQTAKVVGKKDGEVDCDPHGRIRVRFNWMGLSSPAGESEQSFWIRVNETWAGPARGVFSLPRVGDEVLIAFDKGDPSQPIVVGALYNGDAKQPTTLPDQKAAFVIRSRSVPNGAASDYNELRFEDQSGKERLYLQAQRNMEEKIKRDLTTSVGGKAKITAIEEFKVEVGKAKLTLKPDKVRIELGAAHLELDATGQVLLNGQIIRIG